ncbi:hypothetical protein IGI04_027306, partial [Brassica rapa subsp. trilocularis]
MVVPMPLSFTATKKAIASSPVKSTASAYATGGSPFSLPTGGTSLSGSLSISTNKGDLLVSGNGDVLRHADYTRKDEMEDERVDLLLDRIKKNFDWSNTEWPVIEAEETEMEEADTESEADKSVDATDIAADVETSSVHVAGRGKRKIQDEGAETRKKKLLCKRTAEKKQRIDEETKSFIEGLVHSSVNSLGEILREQMASMESMFKERIGNMEIEVSQLREARSLSAEGSVPKSKTDEAAPKTKTVQTPAKKKVNQAQAQAPAKKKDWLKNGIETNEFDFGLSTQELRELSQDTFVDGFDLSQVKVENSKPFNMSPPKLNDEEIDRAGEASADAALVYLRKEDWEKVSTWLIKSKPLRIGPSLLDAEIGTRLMDRTEWLHNSEIDAMMYVYRERTSLKRWKLHRVAFMSVVFSNMIKKEYESFKAGIRKYKLHHLLLQYGKGVLPPHGQTQEIWNVDVDRLYVPVHVSGNHWIALCISFVTRSIDVLDCSGRKRYKELDAFANLVPRIVKA